MPVAQWQVASNVAVGPGFGIVRVREGVIGGGVVVEGSVGSGEELELVEVVQRCGGG